MHCHYHSLALGTKIFVVKHKVFWCAVSYDIFAINVDFIHEINTHILNFSIQLCVRAQSVLDIHELRWFGFRRFVVTYLYHFCNVSWLVPTTRDRITQRWVSFPHSCYCACHFQRGRNFSFIKRFHETTFDYSVSFVITKSICILYYV
jgi:hypothetical protein